MGHMGHGSRKMTHFHLCSVVSAVTSETIFEIVKCIADVDMLSRERMGSKAEIFNFFNSGYAHNRNISILDVGHSFEQKTR